MTSALPQLNRLSVAARLGFSVLIITLLAGYFVAGVHLLWHYENRDGVQGISQDDITAAYHGISQEPVLRAALDRGHPADLPPAERDALIAWLSSSTMSRDYENFELGDNAPVEIIDRSCLSCHARSSTEGDGIGQRVPLEFFDDITRVAIAREVFPNSRQIVAASIHAHAPSMSVIMMVLAIMAFCTPAPRRLTGMVLFIGAIGLAMDFAGQWLARDIAQMSWAVTIGGAASAAATTILALLSFIGLWLPGRTRG